MPLPASVAAKNAFSAPIPPADAPTPTIGNGFRAREEKSTGAAASSDTPGAWGGATSAGRARYSFTCLPTTAGGKAAASSDYMGVWLRSRVGHQPSTLHLDRDRRGRKHSRAGESARSMS